MYLRMPQRLHLELTDKCNAKCPMCKRNHADGLEDDTKFVSNVELTAELIRERFSSLDFKIVNYCGSLGDPLAARDAYDIFEFFANKNIPQTIHTNGSLKSVDWWKRLASFPNITVTFGIDGADQTTHEFYRRNTNLKKILENARAFNDAGGKSIWQFIIFKHNEHQIEDAREMSVDYGFREFETLHTRRFYLQEEFKYSWKGETYTLAKPESSPFDLFDKNVQYQHNIECKSKSIEEVYVSANGQVWPCCYIAENNTLFRDPELYNLHSKGLQEIIQSMYFDELEESFTSNAPVLVCALTCGMGHNNKRNRKINIKIVDK